MPRAVKGQRFGGRAKGIPNKASIEALERERIEQQLAPTPDEAVRAALGAEREVQRSEVTHRKLAKERLEELLEIFIGAAAYHQPTLSTTAQQNPKGDWDKFERWGRLAMDCAEKAAKYQSPQFRAIIVAPAPDSSQPERRKRFTLTIFESAQPALEPPEPPVSVPTSDQRH